jgi:hypothetical protein
VIDGELFLEAKDIPTPNLPGATRYRRIRELALDLPDALVVDQVGGVGISLNEVKGI